MESNKDDAIKCFSLAKKAMETQQYETAIRLTKKSIRLYPTSQAELLLKTLENNKTDKTQHKKTSEPVNDRKYTAEQVKAVKAILGCGRDYYRVLSIERTATDAEIKKAYRKQALQFHPDKNSAPGADEAFKLVSKAFHVLSDSNKRVIHDQGGDAERRPRSTHTYHRRHGDEMTNEDLFNMFFGSGMRTSFNSQDTFRQRQDFLRQQQRRQQQTDNSILPFIPLILIGVLAIVAALFSIEGDPVYSFQPSPPLSSYRTTKSNYIPYYVNPSVFNDIKKNPFKFNKLERQIELDYLGELRSRCQQEQRYRSNLLAEADGILFGIVGRNEKAYKEAQRYEMKNCDQLKKLAGKIRY